MSTPAYYCRRVVTKRKSFITLAPDESGDFEERRTKLQTQYSRKKVAEAQLSLSATRKC